jgi:hypothetical protein
MILLCRFTMSNLLRFFPSKPRPTSHDNVACELIEMTQAVLEDRSLRSKGKRAHASSTWPQAKKQAVAKEAIAGATLNNLRLKYADLPPDNTVRGWVSKVKCAQVIQGVGRPTLLTPEEEQLVMETLRFMRHRGAAIDSSLLILIARKCVSSVRSIPLDATPALGDGWTKSFRKRLRLSKLRKASTDRPPTSPEQFAVDEEWRR